MFPDSPATGHSSVANPPRQMRQVNENAWPSDLRGSNVDSGSPNLTPPNRAAAAQADEAARVAAADETARLAAAQADETARVAAADEAARAAKNAAPKSLAEDLAELSPQRQAALKRFKTEPKTAKEAFRALGLDPVPTPTPKQVSDAWKQFNREVHPNKFAGKSDDLTEVSTKATQHLNAARDLAKEAAETFHANAGPTGAGSAAPNAAGSAAGKGAANTADFFSKFKKWFNNRFGKKPMQ
jgi:hypothetical protein